MKRHPMSIGPYDIIGSQLTKWSYMAFESDMLLILTFKNGNSLEIKNPNFKIKVIEEVNFES